MLKVLLISVIGVASAINFLDFGHGLKKLTHNRIVEHFGVDAVDKGKVEALVDYKIKSFLKKINSLFHQSPIQTKSGQKLKLGKYLCKNCSAAEGENATFIVRSLTVSPDPAQLPGVIKIQFDVNSLQDITKLEINVEMYRTSGGTTMKLPCFGGLIGSCDYGNVCDLLSAITECPEPFIQYNIPCKCPIPKNYQSLQKLRGTFSWKNCGQPSKELFVVEKGSIIPDPIILPGTLTATFAGTVNQTLDAPLKVDLTMEKSIEGLWIHIPCIDGVGSCSYDDLCEVLQYAQCPDPFIQQNVPCKCPFQKGFYTLTSANIEVDISPGALAAGDYRFTANLSMNDAFVACYQVTASFDSPY